MHVVTLSSKGRFVIPASIRRRLGIAPGTQLELREQEDGSLRIAVRRALSESTLREGCGMLRYQGPPRRLSEFDVARAMREDEGRTS